jgi:hypothetical protein
VEKVLNCYSVGVTWKSFEELGETIVQVELLFRNEIDNCQGGKLLGQRSQVENGIGGYSCFSLEIGIAIAVKMDHLHIGPDGHGQTGH